MENNFNSGSSIMPENETTLTMRAGNTTYILSLHFKSDAAMSIEDKMRKMIRKDVETGNF